MEMIPPLRKNWKYFSETSTWSYAGKHGNCEIKIEDKYFGVRLRFKDKEWESILFPCMTDAMIFAENCLKYPDGIARLGWWGKTWRWGILLAILVLLFFYPLWVLSIYAALSYAIMGVALVTRGFSTDNFISDFVVWAFSPLTFLFLMIYFGFRIPAL